MEGSVKVGLPQATCCQRDSRVLNAVGLVEGVEKKKNRATAVVCLTCTRTTESNKKGN